MRNLSKLLLVLLLFSSIFSVIGCNSQPSENTKTETKKLIIGSSTVCTEAIKAAVPSIEKLGYEVEVITYDDFVLPNTALCEGSIDANIFQHKPYLDSYNEKNRKDLYFIKELLLTRVGLFSNKYDAIDNLPEEGKIGIFQDASNQDRSLKILASKNMITLAEKEGLYSLLDIKDNPKNLRFVTMDIAQLVNGLKELDASFEAQNIMVLSKTEPKYTLAIESRNKDNEKYAVGLVVKQENKDAQYVKDIIEAFKTQETKDAMDKMYKGAYEILTD